MRPERSREPPGPDRGRPSWEGKEASPLTSSRAEAPGPPAGTPHVRAPTKVLGKLRQDFLALPLHFFLICGERGAVG